MNEKEVFDQSMIDSIVATAESDTAESKIATLEQEVTEIKGSIKTLLMDIRETMGVLENPFQNIQGIANISSAIVTSVPTAESKTDDHPQNSSKADSKKATDNFKPDDNSIEESELDEVEPIESITINKKTLEELKQAARKLPKLPDSKNADSKLIDPMSFYKTIVWSKDMVEKYDQETIKELVEVFYILGYIPEDVKKIVLKLTEMLDKNDDLDSAVMDLYRLYHILNPSDLSLDSKVLDYVLNENDTVKNSCQRK
ncbi:MAG TPA: hypothetical protein VN278_01660 [Methanosarcina sp.]|nr:hypothetical protein [Methanosarcina sp.]